MYVYIYVCLCVHIYIYIYSIFFNLGNETRNSNKDLVGLSRPDSMSA